MKTIKVLLAYLIVAGAATLAFGGPGPDYHARINKAEKDAVQAKARAAAPAKTPAKDATQVAGCANCSCADMKKS